MRDQCVISARRLPEDGLEVERQRGRAQCGGKVDGAWGSQALR